MIEASSLNGKTAGQINIPDYYFNRFVTDVPVFDNLFGGLGWLPGSVATVSAVKGGGKTTFLLTLLQKYADQGYKVAYASAEEDVVQIAFNCKRIGVSDVPLYNFDCVEDVIKMATTEKLDLLIVDSLQKFCKRAAAQVTATESIIKFAKSSLCSIGIVLHSTKTGAAKGNSSIDHDVDVNIKIGIGDADLYGDLSARVFTSSKNRFGQTVDDGQIVLRLGAKGFDLKNPIADGSVFVTPATAISATDKKVMEKKKDFDLILDFAKDRGSITVADAYKLGIDDVPKIQRYLKELDLAAVLVKQGVGKNARWELSEGFKG